MKNEITKGRFRQGYLDRKLKLGNGLSSMTAGGT
jgi:hypothetical protein